MQEDKQSQRREQIRAAAYAVLSEKGYKATSMLAIAKRAKASNETLYSWYGNKQKLFQTLITENASDVASALQAALKTGTRADKAMARIGPLLLELVTSEKAIALNRAAAADANETGVLGQTLAKAGRDKIAPLLHQLLEQARAEELIQYKASDQVVEAYLGLLLGDVQIRRATGDLNPLTGTEIKSRAARAHKQFFRLFAAGVV